MYLVIRSEERERNERRSVLTKKKQQWEVREPEIVKIARHSQKKITYLTNERPSAVNPDIEIPR
jgi:hypothetical protein